VSSLCPAGTPDPLDWWRRLLHLWQARLDTKSWAALVANYTARPMPQGEDPTVDVRLEWTETTGAALAPAQMRVHEARLRGDQYAEMWIRLGVRASNRAGLIGADELAIQDRIVAATSNFHAGSREVFEATLEPLLRDGAPRPGRITRSLVATYLMRVIPEGADRALLAPLLSASGSTSSNIVVAFNHEATTAATSSALAHLYNLNLSNRWSSRMRELTDALRADPALGTTVDQIRGMLGWEVFNRDDPIPAERWDEIVRLLFPRPTVRPSPDVAGQGEVTVNVKQLWELLDGEDPGEATPPGEG
jgi:hypothetical protein